MKSVTYMCLNVNNPHYNISYCNYQTTINGYQWIHNFISQLQKFNHNKRKNKFTENLQ